ncbi:hypothetical protein CY35_16G030900 [Sphagnum magellanicum]|nr:hypothetical protein CY35_16G030900 [Sphagnum magellanicum]
MHLIQLGGTRCVGAFPWRAISSASSSSATTDGQASLVGLEVQHKQGTWVIKGLVLEILTYVGMNVVPLMDMYFTRIFCNSAPPCLQPVTYTYYSFTSTCAKHEPFCKLPILRR